MIPITTEIPFSEATTRTDQGMTSPPFPMTSDLSPIAEQILDTPTRASFFSPLKHKSYTSIPGLSDEADSSLHSRSLELTCFEQDPIALQALQSNSDLPYDYRIRLSPISAEIISQFLTECEENGADKALQQLQSEEENIRKLGKVTLERLGWKFLQYNQQTPVSVIYCPSLPEWVFKCSADWKKNARRCPMADRLRQYVHNHNLDSIQIPEKVLISIGEQQIVLAQKMNIVSPEKTIEILGKNQKLQEKISTQLCTLIALSGLADTHFENICITTSKETITIIDTDSCGGLLAARLGLKMLIDKARPIKRLKTLFQTAETMLANLPS